MRQILLNSGGAIVARVPRPIVEPGSVLVRVHYSLISVGTELAPLRPNPNGAAEESPIIRSIEYAGLARHYLRASVRDPRKAIDRVKKIARRRFATFRSTALPSTTQKVAVGDVVWTPASRDATLTSDGGALTIVTDQTPAGYQIMSQPFAVPPDHLPIVQLRGRVQEGAVAIGLLSASGASWIGSRTYPTGPFEDTLMFDPKGSNEVTLVVTTAGASSRSRVVLSTVEVTVAPSNASGLPVSELDAQGWQVGYSAAGEIVGVGAGITDLAVGDLVACAGAGQANHADYVSVKRNLVCRVPTGCPVNLAASGTVGAIALQGVRRAAPQLGERVAVLGLGLIGQITAQLLRAAGCEVYGLDLD